MVAAPAVTLLLLAALLSAPPWEMAADGRPAGPSAQILLLLDPDCGFDAGLVTAHLAALGRPVGAEGRLEIVFDCRVGSETVIACRDRQSGRQSSRRVDADRADALTIANLADAACRSLDEERPAAGLAGEGEAGGREDSGERLQQPEPGRLMALQAGAGVALLDAPTVRFRIEVAIHPGRSAPGLLLGIDGSWPEGATSGGVRHRFTSFGSTAGFGYLLQLHRQLGLLLAGGARLERRGLEWSDPASTIAPGSAVRWHAGGYAGARAEWTPAGWLLVSAGIEMALFPVAEEWRVKGVAVRRPGHVELTPHLGAGCRF